MTTTPSGSKTMQYDRSTREKQQSTVSCHTVRERSQEVSLCQTVFQSVHWFFYCVFVTERDPEKVSTVEQQLSGHLSLVCINYKIARGLR